MLRMARFGFQIRYGRYANHHVVDLPRAEDTRQEASQVCCDMIGDVLAALETNPEWQLQVSDETGKPLYLFRFTAETFKHHD
jgi:uncharacterized protein DUF6894